MMMYNVMKPIEPQRKAFEKRLNAFVDSVQNAKVRENYKVFFNNKGKHLRPSLLFFSAKAVQNSVNNEEALMAMALVLELLHSASLIHDDIIDEDFERRGQKTMNSVFGNKVGVLAGDTLFSYAFSYCNEHFEREISKKVTELTLKMCEAELIQANGIDTLEDYLEVIEGKTALFMSVACELGGIIGGGTSQEIEALKGFGMNLGMTYQIMDDLLDHDPNGLVYMNKENVKHYYNLAISDLNQLCATDYKDSMQALLDYVMAM